MEWLDQKVALLINRSGVDPRDYGGKDPEELVVFNILFRSRELNVI